MSTLTSIVEETVVRLLELAVTRIPEDVERALEEASKREDDAIARTQFENMLKNIELAKRTRRPICQDTGIISFFVKAGDQFPSPWRIPDLLANGVKRATETIPLRPNAVDVVSGINSGDNIGIHVPMVEWQPIKGDYLEITAFPKGGGSENMTKLAMLKPTNGLQRVEELVLNAVIEAGAKPCPPVILGVGIAGEGLTALRLAKWAILREIGERNENPLIAQLEKKISDAANATGIGPMGLGGKTTVLDVHIECAHRHPATFAVGIVFQCYLARGATARITSSGEVTYLGFTQIPRESPRFQARR